MAEAPVQNLSSPNDTINFFNNFACTVEYLEVRLWLWCCCVGVILGIPACLVVLRELFQRHQQGTCNDFFMWNLYFIDLIFTAMLLLAACNEMVLKNTSIYGFISFIHCLPMCGRPLFMACICGDCYFAVVHPIIYKTSKKANVIRKAVTLMVWCVTVCFGELLIFVQSIYTSSLISAPLTVALPVITFCNVSILHALRKPDPSGNKNIHPQKRQALYTVFNSLTMTLIDYLPPAIIFLLSEVLQISKEVFFCHLTFLGISFYIVGCVTMPLLYLNSVGKMNYFKSCLKKNVRR